MTTGQLIAMLARMQADNPNKHDLVEVIAALRARVTSPPLGIYTSYVGHGRLFPGMDLVSTNDGSG